MKKILSLIITLTVMQAAMFASERFLNFETFFTTGIPIHSSKTEEVKSDLLLSNTFNRIVSGFSADAILNVTEPLKAIVGADTFCEFIWENGCHYNSLDYSFYLGFKLFPNLYGFDISAAYVLGSKATFAKTDEGKDTNTSSWGNGFRIAAEYTFFYGQDSAIYPIVGGYYRYMPRGNYSYDHILAAYVGIKF